MTIISRGVAKCVVIPQPESKLEGYGIGGRYFFERCEYPHPNGQIIHIYPLEYESNKPINFTPPFYSDCCGPKVFKMYFEIIAEKEPETIKAEKIAQKVCELLGVPYPSEDAVQIRRIAKEEIEK